MAPALLAEVGAWVARGLPLVVARRDPRAPDAIALGLALAGGGKRRVALLVARSAVARVAPPLALGEALRSAPAAWRPRLAALDAEARALGVALGVYGSLAWQHLSGEPYVTPASDVDLLAPAPDAAAREAALALLRRHAADREPALDGELLLPAGRAVAWREALSGAARLLVKSADGVALEPAGHVLGPRAPRGGARRAPVLDPKAVDRAALGALVDELALHPKPGLVSLAGRGAHRDMDGATFLASVRALRGCFGAAARAGLDGAPFAELRALGLRAEARMLDATGGVNTHRGAILALGLLAAAAGRAASREGSAAPARLALRREARRLGDEARAGLPVAPRTHGGRVARRHGVSGARGEAVAGLPHVFDVALPAIEASLGRGAGPRAAALDALFRLVAVLPDTNLLHRGGVAGLAFARAAAGVFVAEGGVHRRGWEASALAVHRAFVARGLSPGGSADLLAAALFVRRLEGARAGADAPWSRAGRTARP